MKRRNFLIGAGGIAIGGSALLGSGAFTRVESQRMVTVQVATDPNAYLGMSPIEGSPNSQNYASLDEQGHLTIDVGEHDDFDPVPGGAAPGEGVNSDSFTWFDDLFQLCNQGKQDVEVSYTLPDPPDARPNIPDDWTAPDPDYDEKVIAFYWINDDGERVIVDQEQKVPLPLGECENIGLRTVTKGVDATIDAPLIDGEAVITAAVPEE
jgi:hypothetical protein